MVGKGKYNSKSLEGLYRLAVMAPIIYIILAFFMSWLTHRVYEGYDSLVFFFYLMFGSSAHYLTLNKVNKSKKSLDEKAKSIWFSLLFYLAIGLFVLYVVGTPVDYLALSVS